MIDLSAYHDKAVALFGAGAAGLSAFSAFYKAGAHVYIWDRNENVRLRLKNIGIKCVEPDDWPWDELTLLMPDLMTRIGNQLSHPVIKRALAEKIPVRSDIDLLAEGISVLPAAERPFVIGVAGTQGKSLTASMISHVLRQAGRRAIHIGESGKPAFAVSDMEPGSIIVVDLPARTLALTRHLHCNAGILLNLTGAETGFSLSPERAVKAATRVFRNQQMDDALIIGADDEICQKICTALSSNSADDTYGSENIIPVSGEAVLGQGIFSLDGHLYDARNGKTASIARLTNSHLQGTHTNQDVAAVYAACLHAGLSAAQITRGLQAWRGLPGRMAFLGCHDQVSFVDDSSARTSRATLAALKALQQVFWVGAPGLQPTELWKWREVAENVEHAIFFGPNAGHAAETMKELFRCTVVATAQEAVNLALTNAEAKRSGTAGGTLLLSPGTPVGQPAALSALMTRTVKARIEGTAA